MSEECAPDKDRKNWWLFKGMVYAKCVNVEHASEAKVVWSPDAVYVSEPPHVERRSTPAEMAKMTDIIVDAGKRLQTARGGTETNASWVVKK